jgi:hypothetical protein
MLFGEKVTRDKDIQEALEDGEIIYEDANPDLSQKIEIYDEGRDVFNKSASQETHKSMLTSSEIKNIQVNTH